MVSQKVDVKSLGGWFVGAFQPRLILSDEIEVGVKNISAGTKPDGHHHKIKHEYTIVISGQIKTFSGLIFDAGDCAYIPPLGKNDHFFPVDTIILVINTPSCQGDKYA